MLDRVYCVLGNEQLPVTIGAGGSGAQCSSTGYFPTNGGNTILGTTSNFGGQLIAYGGGSGAGEFMYCGFVGAANLNAGSGSKYQSDQISCCDFKAEVVVEAHTELPLATALWAAGFLSKETAEAWVTILVMAFPALEVL